MAGTPVLDGKVAIVTGRARGSAERRRSAWPGPAPGLASETIGFAAPGGGVGGGEAPGGGTGP